MGYSVGMGTSNRLMRSGLHKANFEFSCVMGEIFAVGIARPMDYNNERMYANEFDPRDSGIKAKYHRAWRERGATGRENQINVVLWTVHSYGSEMLLCGAREGERRLPPHIFNRDDRFGFILDMDNGTVTLCRNESPVAITSDLTGEFVWVAHLSRGLGITTIKICEWD